MNSNQFEIPFNYEDEDAEDIRSYYVDQSFKNLTIYDRSITSAYTSYGIKCIDSQYCRLIQNLKVKVKNLYAIKRRTAQYSNIKTREVNTGAAYYTYYDKIELDSNYCEVRVEWENGQIYDFFYGNKPIFDKITRTTDPEKLRKDIIDNSHLHVKIKENLILNLDNYIYF